MSAVIVEDEVDLVVGRLVFNDLGHEGLEVDALLGLCGLAADDPGGDFQGGEEVDRAMPLAGALEALNDLCRYWSEHSRSPVPQPALPASRNWSRQSATSPKPTPRPSSDASARAKSAQLRNTIVNSRN